jgi:stalled ribosome rescue protein Dom34
MTNFEYVTQSQTTLETFIYSKTKKFLNDLKEVNSKYFDEMLKELEDYKNNDKLAEYFQKEHK